MFTEIAGVFGFKFSEAGLKIRRFRVEVSLPTTAPSSKLSGVDCFVPIGTSHSARFEPVSTASFRL